jgi:hypothetical protein
MKSFKKINEACFQLFLIGYGSLHKACRTILSQLRSVTTSRQKIVAVCDCHTGENCDGGDWSINWHFEVNQERNFKKKIAVACKKMQKKMWSESGTS